MPLLPWRPSRFFAISSDSTRDLVQSCSSCSAFPPSTKMFPASSLHDAAEAWNVLGLHFIESEFFIQAKIHLIRRDIYIHWGFCITPRFCADVEKASWILGIPDGMFPDIILFLRRGCSGGSVHTEWQPYISPDVLAFRLLSCKWKNWRHFGKTRMINVVQIATRLVC